MQDLYLTEESKKEIIKILTEEYEKILISETISKSNRSTIEKQQIAEIVDYLQNNQNITYADLYKLNESWWQILGKIGKKALGPLGIAWDAVDGGLQLYDLLTKPLPKLPQPLPSPVDSPRPERGDEFDRRGREIIRAPEYPQLAEIVNYLQNSENVTYADLIELDDPANQPPENLPESMKAFWKNRLLEKINHK